MKRSWKKSATVWTMTAALTASYTMVPVVSYAQEDAGILTEAESLALLAEEESSEGETGTTQEESSQGETGTSQEESQSGEAESSQEESSQEEQTSPAESTTPETTQETSESESQSEPDSSQAPETSESVTEESSTQEEESSEEESSEEETTEEETTEEETQEPETEEEEWSEDQITEDTKGLTFTYSEDGRGMTITGFDGSRQVVEIPQTYGGVAVTAIAAGAFANQTGITQVIIPEGVTNIGREAFAGCSALAQIQIPTSVVNIGAKAFDGTIFDTTLTGEVVYINQILYRCQTDAPVVTINPNTKVIAEEAFLNRVNLLAVVIPEGVTYISSRAFAGCSSLSEISFPESVSDIVANAFDDTAWYEQRKHEMIVINHLLYRIPDEVAVSTADDQTISAADPILVKLSHAEIPEGVTAICTLAGANTSIEAVTFPASLRQIHYGAFQNCTSLKQIIVPEGTAHIEAGAFAGCSALQSAVLPQSVKYLGSRAFAGCGSLQTVKLPETLDWIHSGLFENCGALSSVTIPAAVTTIGSRAFAGCGMLYSVTIPEGTATIGAEAFAGSGLNTIVLPQQLQYLGEGAFSDCGALTSAVIPASVTAIRDRMFRNCTELKQIVIPEGIKYIGKAAFQNAVSLHQIAFPQTMLTICDSAFEGSGVGEGLILPTGLRTLGSRAFAGCAALKEITFDAGLRRVGEQVFADGAGAAVHCSFSRNIYLTKYLNGWNHNWAAGTSSVTFTGGFFSEEQLQQYLQQACVTLPDFSQAQMDEALVREMMMHISISAECAPEQMENGWVRVPAETVLQRLLSLTGQWVPGYEPARTDAGVFYYEGGYYYTDTKVFAGDKTYGALFLGTNENGDYRCLLYDAQTGIAEGYVILQLIQSDNDHGITVAGKATQPIEDGYYLNVYESEEIRMLSEQLSGTWTDEEGRTLEFDSYRRILTDSAYPEKSYHYTCEPNESFTCLLSMIDPQAQEEENDCIFVSLSDEKDQMQWIDLETLEVISVWTLQEEQW